MCSVKAAQVSLMLDKLMDLAKTAFADTPTPAKPRKVDTPEFAAAALLLELAAVDGSLDPAEEARARDMMGRLFKMSEAEVAALVAEAKEDRERAADFFRYTEPLKSQIEPEDRIRFLEAFWEIAYADGEVHPYEANLVRRLAGLLHVSDRESGEARKRVASRLEAVGPDGAGKSPAAKGPWDKA